MQAPMTVLYRYNVHVRDVPGTSMYARSAAGACATLVLRLGMGNLRNMTKVVTTEQLYIHIKIVYNIYIGYIQLLVMHLDQIIFLK